MHLNRFRSSFFVSETRDKKLRDQIFIHPSHNKCLAGLNQPRIELSTVLVEDQRIYIFQVHEKKVFLWERFWNNFEKLFSSPITIFFRSSLKKLSPNPKAITLENVFGTWAMKSTCKSTILSRVPDVNFLPFPGSPKMRDTNSCRCFVDVHWPPSGE